MLELLSCKLNTAVAVPALALGRNGAAAATEGPAAVPVMLPRSTLASSERELSPKSTDIVGAVVVVASGFLYLYELKKSSGQSVAAGWPLLAIVSPSGCRLRRDELFQNPAAGCEVLQ